MDGKGAFEVTENDAGDVDTSRTPASVRTSGRQGSIRQAATEDKLKAGDISALDEDEDDDDDAEDEDTDVVDDDEDDELFGYDIETDDDDDMAIGRGRASFDEEGLAVGRASSRGTRTARRGADLSLGGVDVDEDDDIIDFEDDSPGDVLDVSLSTEEEEDLADDAEDDEFSSADLPASALGDSTDDLDAEPDLFDEGSEDELRSAAETLAEGSLLGLGVDGPTRSDSTDLASFALDDDVLDVPDAPVAENGSGRKSDKRMGRPQGPSSALREFPGLVQRAEDTALQEEEEGDEFSGDEFDDSSLEDDAIGGPKNLDAYVDVDDLDDETDEFGVTTATSFGRVWELNDDAYVTITEPGQAYAYDMDEGESEEQEMATVRRGRAGGWGGSLQADARHEAPEGSKEWIARRAYDLMMKAPSGSLFLWSRIRKSPPAEISKLFPDEPPAPPTFGPTPLDTSGLDSDDVSASDDIALLGGEDISTRREHIGASNGAAEGNAASEHVAIERSVDFPCMYKFKVVGGGEDFVESLTEDMEKVLGRTVPSSAFKFEDAGRLQRIIINVEVQNANEVTELYDAVRLHPGVKFSYG